MVNLGVKHISVSIFVVRSFEHIQRARLILIAIEANNCDWRYRTTEIRTPPPQTWICRELKIVSHRELISPPSICLEIISTINIQLHNPNQLSSAKPSIESAHLNGTDVTQSTGTSHTRIKRIKRKLYLNKRPSAPCVLLLFCCSPFENRSNKGTKRSVKKKRNIHKDERRGRVGAKKGFGGHPANP